MRDCNTGARDQEYKIGRLTNGGRALPPSSSAISVLLVDDDLTLREALARSLAGRGCRVRTAQSGLEALAVLHWIPFDVVITDLNMPARNGLWLWRQALLLRPELRGRFVLIASEPLPPPETLSQFLETERYLVKPLSLERLVHEVQDVRDGVRSGTAARRTEPRRFGRI